MWATRHHKRYLKQHHKIVHYNILASCKLNSYLEDIEERTKSLLERTVKSFAEEENVTEELKANDMMLWVRKNE